MPYVNISARALQQTLPQAKQLFGRLVGRVSNWFKGNPDKLAAAGTALQVRGPASKSKILNMMRDNPITSMLLLAEVPELIELVDEITAASPELGTLLNSVTASDTVQSLQSPSLLDDENRQTLSDIQSIGSLTLDQIQAFSDESDLIQRVVARFTGNNDEEKLQNFLEFRKVVSMPVGNFALFEALKGIK